MSDTLQCVMCQQTNFASKDAHYEHERKCLESDGDVKIVESRIKAKIPPAGMPEPLGASGGYKAPKRTVSETAPANPTVRPHLWVNYTRRERLISYAHEIDFTEYVNWNLEVDDIRLGSCATPTDYNKTTPVFDWRPEDTTYLQWVTKLMGRLCPTITSGTCIADKVNKYANHSTFQTVFVGG